MTDEALISTARTMAIGFLVACQRRGIGPGAAADVAGVALAEALGQLLGPVATVERLRLLADVLERDLLERVH